MVYDGTDSELGPWYNAVSKHKIPIDFDSGIGI